MESKRDIYNLWVQYTTKNEEIFFRQFIAGFVQIWKNQLCLDLLCVTPSQPIKADSGPHLSRLPEELLPAITKFIIIARDDIEKNNQTDENLRQTSMLIECLIIIARNFENISTITKHQYIGNLISLITPLYAKIMKTGCITTAETEVFENFCKLLEVVYDPCLSWRNFVNSQLMDKSSATYRSNLVHVEIIPFIYDCFQTKEILMFPHIGTCLINTLGSIISGSQKFNSGDSKECSNYFGDGINYKICDNLNNGMRAICPATVSIIINIISKWESEHVLRGAALKCLASMVIILERSSPEERQIELVTIVQLYSDAICDLLKIQHFERNENNETVSSFEIFTDETAAMILDVNALQSTIKNIDLFLFDKKKQCNICSIIFQTNLFDILVSIPLKIKHWHINKDPILFALIETISSLTQCSKELNENSNALQKVTRLLDGIEHLGKPKEKLLNLCYHLAFDKERQKFALPEVVLTLIRWLPRIDATEQDLLSGLILNGCVCNNECKSVSLEISTIYAVCECLLQFQGLSDECILTLLKIIEELAKLSVKPKELYLILGLLKKNVAFPYSRKLLQSLVTITLHSAVSRNSCAQYLEIRNPDDGISVQNIKNWTISGSYGFIFHLLVRFEQIESAADKNMKSYRRMIFKMNTKSNIGYEIFLQQNGNLVVAAVTRREYLTSSTPAKCLLDGKWHYITVIISPPKRPFSYSQINIYIDFVQKLSSTLKVQSITEPFCFCTIGSASSMPVTQGKDLDGKTSSPAPQENAISRSIFPSLIERTLPSNVTNYFTMPLRNTTPFDPNIKNFPIGMENNVFGDPICIRAQINSVLLADPATNLKTIFDCGENFSSILSQDTEAMDLTSRFVFCYSSGSYCNETCPDLVPGGKFPSIVKAKHYKYFKIQDTIHSIGGVQCILPILENLIEEAEHFAFAETDSTNCDMHFADQKNKNKIESVSDCEILATTSYSEWKMLQNPIASFFCFLRYLTHNNEKNQVDLLNSKSLKIIAMMLLKCNPQSFDVHALMSVHLLIEALQNQKPVPNAKLLDCFYSEIIFNFAIWSRLQFHITLGHIQYLGTLIKNDRKYFRKQFGVQFILDTIRGYYTVPKDLNDEDAKTIRSTLLHIVRHNLQKEINIAEVSSIICFLASVKHEEVLKEILEMILFYLKGKACKDQMILLLYEPNTANLLYNIFIDKTYSDSIQNAAIRIIDCLLLTCRVQQQYKHNLRLQEMLQNDVVSLYPGFFSYITPALTNATLFSILVDQILSAETDYCALVFLVYHSGLCHISQKLELAKKLMQISLLKTNAPVKIAQQVGWQDSISRLLVKRPISIGGKEEEKGFSFETNSKDDGLNFDNDSVEFVEFSALDLNQSAAHEERETTMTFNELQASVTEAANAIENEIKEIAESVTETVTENVSNVFSVIRQRTTEFQESLESFSASMTASMDLDSVRETSSHTRTPSNSSDDSTTQLQSETTKISDKEKAGDSQCDDIDDEDQLVYLITNILFTVLWRGVRNDNPNCWKERGQVLASINLLGLNNELLTSHLLLKLKILEMGVQACLNDLTEQGHQTLNNQENAYQLLRMVYDLVVLESSEDETKKCSIKLLEGSVALIDSLMVFRQGVSDDWSEMIGLSFGLLLKCSLHPNTEIMAMATSRLHVLLQNRSCLIPNEMGYLLFSVNQALRSCSDDEEKNSFLMPVVKVLLEKCWDIFSLETSLPDFPDINTGPAFFKEFNSFILTNKWCTFIDKKIKPLYELYQKENEQALWEPINRFWAECFEACKMSMKKRDRIQMEGRKYFQQKIITPWKVKQLEEATRLNAINAHTKANNNSVIKRWKMVLRFLNGPRGTWYNGTDHDEFWKLSNHENIARMRLKLEPQLFPTQHEDAAHLRDNAAYIPEAKNLSDNLDSTIKMAVVQDFLTDDENILLDEDLRCLTEGLPQESSLKKVLITQNCELITLMSKIKGRIEVNQNMFTFIDSAAKEDKDNYDFGFPITKIREIHLRKYNLRRSALEIFLLDQTSYFLNFTTKIRNKVFEKLLRLQPPNILYGTGRSPPELLKASGLTQKWITREISNFEYLMYLNTIAGRSYNDLSQYPVFPWIIADYTSNVLDLSDRNSFRDLSKPIGVVNAKNEIEVRAKFNSFEDPSGTIPKFHYGTHYSNSAGVLHYLLRMEPFTSLHIDLQSGRFDVADRQFHSIPQTWKLLMDNPNDVKELIPEFFYFPEFLKNMNKFDLGHLQITKEKVNDVVLPPWANTAEEFIEIHRRALESEYVSQHLNLWIDLIFGYKQKGKRAVEALNVFYYCSYEGAVDLDKIQNLAEREAVEGMINNFGQIPSQLLREPHPRRLTQEECLVRLLKCELKKPELTQFLDRSVKFHCNISTPQDPIIFLSAPRSPPKSFLQISPDILISVSKSQILGCNSWMSYDKEKGFVLEIDATTTNIKNRKKIFGPFHPSIEINSHVFGVSVDGKYLFAGGICDFSLRAYNLHKGKTVASVISHSDIITCLALDNCGSYLATGSKDCTCIVWSLTANQHNFVSSNSFNPIYNTSLMNTNNALSLIPVTILYGHQDAITCVAIYTELDMVVSGSKDGTVNVYSIQDGQLIRTLKPQGCSDRFVEISFLTISYQGHIAFAALDDTSHSLHIFSINGTSLGSKYVSARVTGLTSISDYLVVVDDAGEITLSRLYRLKPVLEIPLHVPIQTVVVSRENTHILAPLRDGKLAVIGVSIPVQSKKQNILNM